MTLYIYKLVSSEEEKSICNMEARAFFKQTPLWDGQVSIVSSKHNIDINRSVFIKWKVEVLIMANSVDEFTNKLTELKPICTYRLHYLESVQQNSLITASKQQRRDYEKLYSSFIKGEVDLKHANIEYGIVELNAAYYIGKLTNSENTWLKHAKKPREYSTALSTRLARTIVNIAIPKPDSQLLFVDPCCGIGTVLLEVANLGVKAQGYDLNPVVLKGTRENIAYFNYNVIVKFENMLNITEKYDVAVLDLPYNLCSVLPEKDKKAMIEQLQHIAKRFVIVTIEPIDSILDHLSIEILDYAVHYKGKFKRELFLCGNENGILN